MYKVRAIYGKLIIRIQHALEGEFGFPWIRAAAGQNKHAVVYGWAVDGTLCILQWWRIIVVWGCGEYSVCVSVCVRVCSQVSN